MKKMYFEYLLNVKLYEKMIEDLEDLELLKLAQERMKESSESIRVDLNDL